MRRITRGRGRARRAVAGLLAGLWVLAGCGVDPVPESWRRVPTPAPSERDPITLARLEAAGEAEPLPEGLRSDLTEDQQTAFFPPRDQQREYTLKINDVITVRNFAVSGEEVPIADVTGERRVFLDGTVNFGFLGSWTVAGETPQGLAVSLTATLKKRGVRAPNVSVLVKEFQPNRVNVFGSFPMNGEVSFTGPTKLFDLLGKVKWRPDKSDIQEVVLVRGPHSLWVPIGRMARRLDFERNPYLLDGDSVIGIERSPIALMGEVKQGPRYTIDDRPSITLREALDRAGGVKPTGDRARARLFRPEQGAFEVDLSAYPADPKAGTQVLLERGDLITVPEWPEQKIFVLGEVKNPGTIIYRGPVTALQVLADAHDINFGGLPGQAQLVRGYPEHPQVITLDLEAALSGEDLTQNVPLTHGDILYIPKSGVVHALDYISRVLGPTQGGLLTATYGKTLRGE